MSKVAPLLPLDPELEALPAPRRPWRRATLSLLVVTGLASASLAWGLRSPATYALERGAPRELGTLQDVKLGPSVQNQWVHLEGPLGEQAAEYRRPLDPDRYRLAPVAGVPRLWVELRIPAELDPARYVAPNSFVGRLTPVADVGPHRASLELAGRVAGGSPLPEDAWVLIDGEAPATTRWTIGLVALLVAFSTFCTWGLFRLLAREPADEPRGT